MNECSKKNGKCIMTIPFDVVEFIGLVLLSVYDAYSRIETLPWSWNLWKIKFNIRAIQHGKVESVQLGRLYNDDTN